MPFRAALPQKAKELVLNVKTLLNAPENTATKCFDPRRRTWEPDRTQHIGPDSRNDHRAGFSYQVFAECRLIDAEREPKRHTQIKAAHQVTMSIDRMKDVRRHDSRPNRHNLRDDDVPRADTVGTCKPRRRAVLGPAAVAPKNKCWTGGTSDRRLSGPSPIAVLPDKRSPMDSHRVRRQGAGGDSVRHRRLAGPKSPRDPSGWVRRLPIKPLPGSLMRLHIANLKILDP